MSEKADLKEKAAVALFAIAAVVRRLVGFLGLQWLQRFVWVVFLIWAACVWFTSVPYYSLVNWALLAVQQGDFERAHVLLADAAKESTRFARDDNRRLNVYALLAALNLRELRYQEAADCCRQFLSFADIKKVGKFQLQDVRIMLADADIGLGDLREARALLEVALTVDSRYSVDAGRVYWGLARANERSDRRPEHHYENALSIFRQHPSAIMQYRACLKDYLRYLHTAQQADLHKAIVNELLIAHGSDRPWAEDCCDFACHITSVLLQQQPDTIRPTSVAEMEMTPTVASKWRALHLPSFASQDRLRIDFVKLAPVDARGFSPALVQASVSRKGQRSVDYFFKFGVGVNKATGDPILADMSVKMPAKDNGGAI